MTKHRPEEYICEISPTKEMREEAKSLREGKILCVYTDCNSVRMETEEGEDPYVWRKDTRTGRMTWKPMRLIILPRKKRTVRY